MQLGGETIDEPDNAQAADDTTLTSSVTYKA
jgi:hypothetical protein